MKARIMAVMTPRLPRMSKTRATAAAISTTGRAKATGRTRGPGRMPKASTVAAKVMGFATLMTPATRKDRARQMRTVA